MSLLRAQELQGEARKFPNLVSIIHRSMMQLFFLVALVGQKIYPTLQFVGLMEKLMKRLQMQYEVQNLWINQLVLSVLPRQVWVH